LSFLLILFHSELIANGISHYKITPPEDTVTIPGKQYKAGKVKRLLLGNHYREEWTTHVNVKIIDIDTLFGGLKPIKQGGSMQTTNLRLEDKDGRQYVIRSINKTPTKALPENLKKTVVADIFQDQTSSEHPFAPLTIPYLAKHAGIFYTNPQMVYIPYDTAFGEFASTFANMLAYIEERPDGNMSHSASSGHSKKVIGTDKMFEELYEDSKNKVDENLFIRTRLFDMLIGDWGRHEDQWRWASYKTENGKLFKPIPRDRDHVFFKSDGIIPHLSSRKWGFRKNQNFGYHVKDIIGLNLSATSIDKAIFNRLGEKDWIAIADSLKNALPDSVIEFAIGQMPAEIFSIHGEEIIAKLKSRRNDLTKIAEDYYKEISKEVDIIGSEKDETYFIKRISSKETEVYGFNESKDTIYHRLFTLNETKEIRIYGLGGSDRFYLTGKTKKGPRIRIIGGIGADTLVDKSKVRGFIKKNFYYDSEKENDAVFSNETIDKRSDIKWDSVNLYKRSGYKYNVTAPVPTYEFNMDDGLFLGLGLRRRTHRFRRQPYSTYQSFGLNYATSTNALSFRYTGDFKSVKGKWNISLNSRINGPKYRLNYFGMGNETTQDVSSISYYRVKAIEFIITPVLYKNLTEHFEIGIGPQYQYIDIQQSPGRFISSPEAMTDPSTFKASQYLGIKGYTRYSTLNNTLFPTGGFRWNVVGGFYQKLGSSKQFTNIASDFAFFLTPKFLPRVTFASRIGAATNIGDFEFYQSNTLGATTNLRGNRKTRFYGRTSFFQNIEARIKLADINFYLFPGKVGILLFYDYGRVWVDNENSKVWHSGLGPGFWLQIHNKVALTGTYGISTDRNYLNIQIGFLY
jgi:hypothetical protein